MQRKIRSGGPPVSDPQTTTTGVPQTTTTVGCITRKIIKSLVIKYYNPSIRDNDVERTKIRKQIKKYVTHSKTSWSITTSSMCTKMCGSYFPPVLRLLVKVKGSVSATPGTHKETFTLL